MCGPGARLYAIAMVTTWVRVALVVLVAGSLGCNKEMKQGKRSEASLHLQKIANGAKLYFVEGPSGGAMTPPPPQFPPSEPLTPEPDCCAQGGRCAPGAALQSPGWDALHFSIDEPHFFQYSFTSSCTGDSATFTSRAVGCPGC